MITSDELSELRKGGKSDDDLLRLYREFDPSNNDDIDFMLKDGRKPKQILDDLARFHGSPDAPKAEPAPDPMADKGILEKSLGAARFGGANLARGLAKTAKIAGWNKTGDFLEAGAKSVEPTPGSYDPAGSRFDVTDPKTYGYAPRALLEGAPGVAADLAGGAVGGLAGPAGAVAGFGAVNAARNFGPNLEARMEHQAPGAVASGSDYAAAGASTVAEAAMSRLGLNPALTSVAKGGGVKAMAQIPGLIAKATGAEAAAGAAGDVINQVGRTAGTKDGLQVDPKEVGNVAALSGATGGVIRTARGVADVTNAARFSGVDESAAARAVSRMDATGIEPTNAKSAFERVEMARKTGDTELNDAHQVLRPLLKSKGNDTDLDETRTLVKTTLTQLKANGEAKPEQLTALRDRLGDTQEGSRLIDLMEERNALNQMASKGNYDARDGTFAGGIAANKTVDGLLNPKHYLGAKLLGGAGVAGVAELPMFAQIGVLGPALAKLAAAQAGTYGAVRTLDRVTGLRNPAQEFSNRFRGMQQAGGEDLPSFRQEAADQQASKETFKDNSASIKQTIKAGEASRKLRETGEAQEAKQAATRSKQEEAAWKLKATQEAQEARQAEQADKAWSTREASPEARQAQEEAMWRQNDATMAKSAEEDATAQAGIHAGYSELLKQAVLSGQASKKLRQAEGKQKDAAWTQKGRQDTAQARLEATVNRDYGKAEAQRSQKSPDAIKAAQEEAMWRDQESPGGPTDWSDQDSIAAIQKALSARQKASEFIVGQSKKDAPKAKVEQPVQQAQADASPPSIRQRLEDAYLAETKGETGKAVRLDAIRKRLPDLDRETVDEGLKSILGGDKEGGNRARLSQFSDPKSMTPSLKEATYSPMGEPFHIMWLNGKSEKAEAVPEALKVRVRAKAKAEKASAAQDVNPETIRISHGDQVVERPIDGIKNQNAYAAKTKARMEVRQSFVDDILSETGKGGKAITDTMLTKLNNGTKSWKDAQSLIEDYINELPEKHWGKAWDAYSKHEGKLRGTYRE